MNSSPTALRLKVDLQGKCCLLMEGLWVTTAGRSISQSRLTHSHCLTWSWCGVPQDEHDEESTLDWLLSGGGKDLVFRQYSGYSEKNLS